MQQAIAAIAVHRHRKGFIRPLDPNHRRIGTRPDHRVRPYHVVILLIDPAFARDRRCLQQGQQCRIRILHIGKRIVVQVGQHILVARRRIGPFVARPVIGQRLADGGRALLGFPAYAGAQLADNVFSFARDESELLARGDEARGFRADHDAISARVDALVSRVDAVDTALDDAGPTPRVGHRT